MIKSNANEFEPIAIVGMACRFPKGLDSPQLLWEALQARFSAIDTVPAERWTADRYFSSNAVAKGKAYIRRGGFLSQDIGTFDASFFGISPRDAENMDPQQRLLLEVVWESFENAGLSLPSYAGRDVGSYVGGFMLDHMITQMTPSNRSQNNQNTAAGMMMTMLSNRISHTYDLRGPSLSIDTACSSSLVAFHYACQDIWRGDCEMAIVGGANVMLRPEYPMGMCKGHFLARDGECKSFDERGDGYGRGEGAASILLKPLSSALADGDAVLATVLGTGANQDGHTPGISMPSGPAQKALIEQVCKKYEIDPSTIRYVECHGTGTAIGDPTEAGAIGSVYGHSSKGKTPVVIGSVKSNIGHLEAAAGVAGVIKGTLTLMHRQATPLANLKTPNPNIDFDGLGLRLADTHIAIGVENEPINAAVNSFGYGGTNAHVILQSAPAHAVHQKKQTAKAHNYPNFLPISARSDKAVAAMATKYRDMLAQGTDLNDLLYSVSMKRAHLSNRAVVKGQNREELMASLEALASGVENEGVAKGTQPFHGHRKPVFVFTGMGPQWWGMGQELYQADAIYRETVDEADRVLQEIAGFSILAEMMKTEAESRIQVTQFAQPANLMIQLGVYAMLRAAGVEPAAVVGHSVGELGSAYAAGVLTLKDVLTVCYHRSRLQATCAGHGVMMAVGVSKEQAAEILERRADRVSIAAVNGPTNVTLAGDGDQMADIAIELQAAGIFHKKLEVEVPYHSPMMDPIMDALHDALVSVQPQMPLIPLYSTVTGKQVTEVTYGADYWPKNVRQSVEFAAATQSLVDDGYNIFLEVGPHPVLSSSLRDCIKAAGREFRLVHTLRRNQPEVASIHKAIMSVYASGGDLNWTVHNDQGDFIALPNYAWQRERFWLENDRAVQDRIAPVVHPMLGIQEAPGTPVWRNDFDHEPMNYLRDHVVTGMPILPAAGYVECLLELAAFQFPEHSGLSIREFDIRAPMIINADRGLDCVTSFDPLNQSATIRGLENGKLGTGQIHIVAKLSGVPRHDQVQHDLNKLMQGFADPEDIAEFYRSLDQMGLSYGPAFQTVRELRLNDKKDKVLSRIEMQSDLMGNLSRYKLHPTLLDACFQTLSSMLGDSENMYLPTGFSELCLYTEQCPAAIWCLGEKTNHTSRHIDCNLTLLDEHGNLVATLRGMRSTAASKRERRDRFGDRIKRQVLTYQWSYAENLSEPKRLGYWLVVGASSEKAIDICSRLEHYGATVAAKVSFGSAFGKYQNEFIVRAGSGEDATTTLAECGELDGVVFLIGLDAKANSSDPTGEHALVELIPFVQALAKSEAERKPRVYVVTQCGASVSENDAGVHPGQSALNGFARVAFNELEGMQFGSIDLPARVHDETIDAVTLELLCDAPHDEVALRGSMRLTSELKESTVISDDRIDYVLLDDEHPVQVRALRPDCESIGTARVLAMQLPTMRDDAVRIRIEASIVPTDLLLDPTSETIDQPVIEFVGMVLEVGNDVSDLKVGMRVCGFAPSDIASHMVVARSSICVAEIAEAADAAKLVSAIGLATCAERCVDSLDTTLHDTALIHMNPMAIAVSHSLRRKGVSVSFLTNSLSELDQEAVCGSPVYLASPVGIAKAVQEQTGGKGFNVLVAGMQSWTKSFDLDSLCPGGSIVDTDVEASAVSMTKNVRSVVRSDYRVLLQRPSHLESSLKKVVELVNSNVIPGSPVLEISIADIAWQKLPLADTSSTMVLTYETRGKDLPVVQLDTLRFDSAATYLVTGGFGGFGQKTAEWLIQNGARHLVLTGRTGADTQERQDFVRKLEARGCSVKAAACDTADFTELAKLFGTMAKSMPALKGVFHSGALIIDQPIAEIDFGTLGKVMQSKATGAWNLHLLTREMNLDHFVLYSSIANLVGNSRQAAYSAANGFLNGLAAMRRSQNLPGTSVNWGAISDVGVVAQDEKLEQFLRYTGLRGISSSEGLEVLGHGLARGVVQLGITMITSWADWARFETRGAKSPRFATLIANDSEVKDNTMRDALIEELSKMDHADQVELLGGLIVEVIASVLKSDPASIPLDCSINQLGVDSLMATEIQLLLDTKLGLSISILELIGEATVRSVATQALKTLMGEQATLVPMPVR